MPEPASAVDRWSVVLPTRDTRDLTLRALRSVAREAPRAEVVVVDDAGSDDTAESVRREFPRARLLRQPVSRGYAAAVNSGLQLCGGDRLLLLNSDTELRAGGLAALDAAFAQAPRLGIAGAQLYYPDGRPQWSGGSEPTLFWFLALGSGWGAATAPYRHLRRRIGRRGAAPAEITVDWVSGAALALRRPVFEALGPIDESYAFYAQDLDYCRRAAAAGWEIGIVTGCEVLHWHGATVAPTGEGQRLELLWPDLVRWVRRARGLRPARRARRALLWASWLRRSRKDRERARLARRALAAPFLDLDGG